MAAEAASSFNAKKTILSEVELVARWALHNYLEIYINSRHTPHTIGILMMHSLPWQLLVRKRRSRLSAELAAVAEQIIQRLHELLQPSEPRAASGDMLEVQ